MANKIAKYTAIILLALAPVMKSFAQEQPPLVPFNGASELQNNGMTLSTRPNEIGLVTTLTDKQITGGMLGNYTCKPSDATALGLGITGSTTVTYKGLKTNSASAILGLGYQNYQAGVKLPFSGKDNKLISGPVSFQLRYLNPKITNDIGLRTGLDITPGSENYKKAAVVTADLISKKYDAAVSSTLKWEKGKKPQWLIGAEKRLGGLQFGVSGQIDQNKKFNPNFSVRKVTGSWTANANYLPQQKTVKVGIGMKF